MIEELLKGNYPILFMNEKLLVVFIFIIYGCSDSLYPEFETENKELAKSSIAKSTISDDYLLFYSLFRAQFYNLTDKQKSHLNAALLKIMGILLGQD